MLITGYSFLGLAIFLLASVQTTQSYSLNFSQSLNQSTGMDSGSSSDPYKMLNDFSKMLRAPNHGTLLANSDLFPDSPIGVPRYSRAFERRSRNCPTLRYALPNGWVKLRSNNRIARFSCNVGFDLIGSRFATCIRGRWNRDLPVCVSSGCYKIEPQPPLKVKKLYEGNVLDLSCELGYILQVNTSSKNGRLNLSDDSNEVATSAQTLTSFPYATLRVYCIGLSWRMDDQTLTADQSGIVQRVSIMDNPECAVYEAPVNKSMLCDFEESICGWNQDFEDDFDWLRNHHTTPSHLDGTGPSFDHTYGQNNSGYYLYMESSYPRIPNEIARLYSPVYQHLDNKSTACFQFSYHMYGKAIGSLRVFVKEKAQVLKELNPKWELVGDQGNSWFDAQIEIHPLSEENIRPFQIIIEAEIGHGHEGDIAIDDLMLALGQNCTMKIDSNDSDSGNVNNSDYGSDSTDTTTAATSASIKPAKNGTDLPNPEGLKSSTTSINAVTGAGQSTTVTTPSTTTTTTTVSSVSQVTNTTVSKSRNSLDDLFRVIFKKKKYVPTVKSNANASSSNETNKIDSSSSSLQPSVTNSTVSPLSAISSSTSKYSKPYLTSTTSKYQDIKWWKTLHEQMKQAIDKHVTKLNDLKNSTSSNVLNSTVKLVKVTPATRIGSSAVTSTTTSTSTASSVSPILNADTVSENVSTAPNSIIPDSIIISRNSSLEIGEQYQSRLESNSHYHEHNGTAVHKLTTSTVYGSLVVFVCLVAVVSVAIYSVYSVRHSHASATSSGLGPNNINNVVAMFVRRCKVFHNIGGNSDDHDGEMLMMNQDDDSMMTNTPANHNRGSSSSSSSNHAHHSNNHDNFVYDNFSESRVFLQPNPNRRS